MVLENVPRIRAPSAERFFSEWVRPGLPVILTDLFDAVPLRRVDTLDRAGRELARVPVLIQPNYLSFLETGSRGAAREMSLGDYLAEVERNSNTRDLCVEFASPHRGHGVDPAGGDISHVDGLLKNRERIRLSRAQRDEIAASLRYAPSATVVHEVDIDVIHRQRVGTAS